MIFKSLSLLSLGVGIFFLVQIIMPVISYQLWEFIIYQQNTSLVAPVSAQNILGISIENKENFLALVSSSKRQTPPSYEEFKLSVPAINIEEALVKVESNDFEDSLAQLPGTALPGEKGNVFITGHSSLPQLFRSDNYNAIFAYLQKVKKGDQIIATVGGQEYKYIVSNIKIVNPSDTSVINPPDDTGRFLTLMTCVPPGFYTKRLIVLAELK